MKKTVKFILIVSILLLVSWLGYKTVKKLQSQKQVAINTATIPQFTFQTIEHQSFHKQNIKDTLSKVVIMLFSPDCEHCQNMAQSMSKHKENIKDMQFIMVTPFGDSTSVAQFAQTYGLDSLSNVQLLLDTKAMFPTIFGTSLVPSFYVYKNNQLVKSIKGETKIENLINQ